MIFQAQDGSIHELHSQDLSLFLPGANPGSTSPEAIPVAAVSSFGQRPGQSPAATLSTPASAPLVALPPGQPALDLELHYQAPGEDPALGPAEDKAGDRAEIFAYRPQDEKNRAAWIRLGDAVRVENLTLAHFTPEQECDLLQREIRNEDLTREEILEELEANRSFTRSMRYIYRAPVSLTGGPWVIYVNFQKLGRHRIWRNVTFPQGGPLQLRYSWSSMWSFGR
jgi:hypothetical protein